MRWVILSLIWMAAAAALPGAAAADMAGLKAGYQRPLDTPSPAYNPTTPEKVTLGRALFFDKRLSAANDLSCASCHQPAHAFEDRVALSFGTGGAVQKRHTPTLMNLAWGRHFAWDGRVPTLEAFVISPIQGTMEMGQDLGTLMAEFDQPEDVRLFQAAFPGEALSIDQVSLSVAAYVRTLVSPVTAFDRWIAGDATALTDEQVAGFELFNGKAGCVACHSGWRFTDDAFHDTGLASDDQGRGALGDGDTELSHAFKTPGLRDLRSRAPYMHDGSLADLDAVIDHYLSGGASRPHSARGLTPRSLSSDEKLRLKDFLGIL